MRQCVLLSVRAHLVAPATREALSNAAAEASARAAWRWLTRMSTSRAREWLGGAHAGKELKESIVDTMMVGFSNDPEVRLLRNCYASLVLL